MNAELKAKWIAALRSGDYKQGKPGVLLQSGSYCCLGVLCEVAAPGALQKHLDEGSRDLCTANVNQWVDHPPNYDMSNLLANMNDGTDKFREVPRKSFAEIADYIEAYI